MTPVARAIGSIFTPRRARARSRAIAPLMERASSRDVIATGRGWFVIGAVAMVGFAVGAGLCAPARLYLIGGAVASGAVAVYGATTRVPAPDERLLAELRVCDQMADHLEWHGIDTGAFVEHVGKCPQGFEGREEWGVELYKLFITPLIDGDFERGFGCGNQQIDGDLRDMLSCKGVASSKLSIVIAERDKGLVNGPNRESSVTNSKD